MSELICQRATLYQPKSQRLDLRDQIDVKENVWPDIDK